MQPILVFLAFAATPLFAQSKNVRFSVSAISVSELPFKIAQVTGLLNTTGQLEARGVTLRSRAPLPPWTAASYGA
jgi:hypothetical protein